MAVFQGKDGELRLYDYGNGGTTYYFEILFCEMDFNSPLARPKKEDNMIMDRGQFDSNAHYVSGMDDPRYAPIPVSFSCRIADTVNTQILSDWLSGVTGISNAGGGATTIYSWNGKTTIDGNTLPDFADVSKMSFRMEMLWNNVESANNDLCLRFDEVYFPPDQQTVSESPDNLMLSCNGLIYGDVTRTTAFFSGSSILAFS